MAAMRQPSPATPSPKSFPTTFFRSTNHHTNDSTMSNASSTPSSQGALPAAGMSSLSLYDRSPVTPTPRGKKASSESESSLRAITPPNSNRSGAPLVVDSAGFPFSSHRDMFLKALEEDDVFGHSSFTIPNQTINAQSTSAAAIAKVHANMPTQVPFQQTPRIDRMNSPITAANAQGLLPPEACLFVANLSVIRSDDQLEIVCHEHFDLFGNCYIKVRRDKYNNPFALVQYHNVEDSNNAIRASHDVVIDGRKIRVEHSQARRAVVLTKLSGGTITVEEAKNVLENYGPISQMYSTTTAEAREMGLPEGMWIQFAYYLDFKDAVKSFNAHTAGYRIHVPPDVEARTLPGPIGSPMISGFRNVRSTTDQKSIFVGNLPSETTEQDLREVFCEYGFIRAINVINKQVPGGSAVNNFGFIEFSTMSEAELAATMEVEIHGRKIRVEPKEYSARRHARLSNYTPPMTPFYFGPRPAFNSLWNSHNGPTNWRSGFHPMQNPSQHNVGYNTARSVNETSPFHHQGGFNNIYNTPPPSTRMPPRNPMHYNGSPHPMHQWSPFITGSAYTGGMARIPEELEGKRY